jgi:Raf kinase inhibitor-like YbhB/YbcL family protein
MRLWSDSWSNGERIPTRHALGRLDPKGVPTFSDDLNPHLAWSELPAAAKSLVLICHDFDVPSRADDVDRADREVPADLPRVDFFHWVLVDLPPVPASIAEGEFSAGFTVRGKPGPRTIRGARQGLNDYTGWFAGDKDMGGNYFGYDGPCPPWNDSILHHYRFTVYALAVARVPLEGKFGGADVRRAIEGHVLASAQITGTYTLNPRLA